MNKILEGKKIKSGLGFVWGGFQKLVSIWSRWLDSVWGGGVFKDSFRRVIWRVYFINTPSAPVPVPLA